MGFDLLFNIRHTLLNEAIRCRIFGYRYDFGVPVICSGRFHTTHKYSVHRLGLLFHIEPYVLCIA